MPFYHYRKEYFMANVAILYCKRIKDHSCVGCAKCYKGMKEENGEFARHDEVNLTIKAYHDP